MPKGSQSGDEMTRHTVNNPTFITATEIRRNFAAVVRKIRRKREPAIIQSSGESVAVLMSMSEYERLLRYQRLAAFNKLARKIGEDVEKSGLTEEQLTAELEETKREVFREQYGSL
jgi:prevent-host-death family protein